MQALKVYSEEEERKTIRTMKLQNSRPSSMREEENQNWNNKCSQVLKELIYCLGKVSVPDQICE